MAGYAPFGDIRPAPAHQLTHLGCRCVKHPGCVHLRQAFRRAYLIVWCLALRRELPVTARLSKLFYERLGEEVANELVDWFNAVDATYRSDLKDLNELNFARFDAKLEQRMAALDTRLDTLRADLRADMAGLEAKFERRLGEQTRWLFVAWASLLIPIIGLWMRK